MKRQNYRIRAVQVDLARQMETISFLKEFIDFIAEHHYNTLFLYLEWRIRTKTFDIGKNGGYSAKELREIIDYASRRRINVIPGLATLGHAELLLRQEKYASCSELREEIKGRFGQNFSSAFCPSLMGTREFLASYLSDVAEIFTETPFFHVGGDEVFDMDFCSECRKKAPDFRGEEKLYLDHFKFIHQTVTGLGKRMMLWDDMFEMYPDILSGMPRDIIMVNWQYQENVRGYLGHFCNCCFLDLLKEYDRLGFDYLIAPADFCWNNIDTSTVHGNNYHPLGSLLTSWEKSTSLLYKFFPTTAAAGLLWDHAVQNGDSAIQLAAVRLFEITDAPFLEAVAQYANLAQRMPDVSLSSLCSFRFSGPDSERFHTLKTLTSILTQYSKRLRNARAKIILNDILSDCNLKILEERSSRACWNLFNGLSGENPEKIMNDVADAGKKYADFYIRNRRRCDVGIFREMIEKWVSALREIPVSIASKGFVKVLFVLPDAYGVERIRILVNGREIASGVFKNRIEDTIFEKYFFIPADTAVKKITFEAQGFAGEGFAYVSAQTAKGKFVPDSIVGCAGIVEHPEYLLSQNINFTYLGSQNSIGSLHDRAIAETVNSITVSMKKVK
ncbi:MAG: family 20 glycosylhydrolase [Lentisphaeria bacterium]|nr:family 20 glycosylhydrolase [Lentisphaeria bacterium]